MKRPDLAAMALCAVIVVGIVALAMVGHSVPDVLTYLATAALSAGAGIAVNAGYSSTSTSAPAAEPAPAAALPLAAMPVPLTSEPATGVFRAATHAP